MQLLFYLRLQDTRKKFSNETLVIDTTYESMNEEKPTSESKIKL